MLFSYDFSDIRCIHAVSGTQAGERGGMNMLLYQVSGRAEYSGGVLRAGEIALIEADQPLNLRTEDEHYLCSFSTFLIPGDLIAVLRDAAGCYSISDTPLPALFSRFDSHLAAVGTEPSREIRMLFRCVLMEILIYLSCIIEKAQDRSDEKNAGMEPVLHFIARNLERPLQIRDICAEFHYSRSHLCKSFTQATGVPLMQYIRTARADFAEQLIRSGISATEAARRLGYSDYSSFYRMYRKHASCAPSLTGKK